MKICPFCRRPLLDNVIRCSYPDCGRDLSNIPSSPSFGTGPNTVPPPPGAPAGSTGYSSSGFSGSFSPSVPPAPTGPAAPITPASSAGFSGSSSFAPPAGTSGPSPAFPGPPGGVRYNPGVTPPPGFNAPSGFNPTPGFNAPSGAAPASGFQPARPGQLNPSGNNFPGNASGLEGASSPTPRPPFSAGPSSGSAFSPASAPPPGPASIPTPAPTPATGLGQPVSFQPSGGAVSGGASAHGERKSAAPPLPPTSGGPNGPGANRGQFGTNIKQPQSGAPNRGEQRSAAPPLPPTSGGPNGPGANRSQFGTNIKQPQSGAPNRGEQRSAAPPLPGAGHNMGNSNPMGERTSAPPPAPGMFSRMWGRSMEQTSAAPPPPGSMPGPAPGYPNGERTSTAPPLAGMRNILQMGLPLSVPSCGVQSAAIPSSLLVIHDDDTPEQASLRETLRSLHGRVLQSRKNTRRLAMAVWAVLGCILLCYCVYYSCSVGSYAELAEDELSITRDKLNPLELVISYKPNSTGYIGFRRTFKKYSTEVFEKISHADGLEKEFRWRGQTAGADEQLLVSYRDGIKLAHQNFPLPKIDISELDAGMLAAVKSGTSFAMTGRGHLSGQVLSALDKSPVVGATVRIVGTDVQTKTDADGKFALENVPEGANKVEASLAGYTTETFEQTIYAGNENDIRVTMSPGLKEGQIRLVLTWNNSVQDLDAYLSGPKGNGENFRVSYSDKGNLQSNEFVSLDVDAQKGWGPETITILGVQPGEYEYQVHDYSNKDKPGSTALANAEARVKLYYGGQAYNFVPEKDLVGGLWNVCKIEVTADRQVKVLRVNTIIREEESEQKFGLYAKRTMANRTAWIGKYGGSQESERAVTLGLDWLCRHQADDGSWGKYCLKESGSGKDKCSDDTCTGCGANFEMAQTGLPLLAFQGGGHFYFNGNKYSDNVKTGLDWIVSHQAKNGLLVSPSLKDKKYGDSPYHQYYMYEHGIASFALVEACAVAKSMGEDPDPTYYKAAQKALKFTQSQQYPDGGWRYWSADRLPKGAVGDTSATGWQVLALKSGKEADIPVDPQVVERLKQYFTKRFMGDGQTGYEDKSNWTQATTGIGMLARQFLLNEPDSVEVRLGAEYLANWAPSHWTTPGDPNECDCYEWYHTMLAMYQAGGREWARFNPVLRDFIIKQQKLEGCQAGSWDPLDNYSAQGGRIYTTSLSALALEVYYRYAGAQERTGTVTTQTPSIELTEAQSDQDYEDKLDQEKQDARLKYAKEAKEEPAPEVDLGL